MDSHSILRQDMPGHRQSFCIPQPTDQLSLSLDLIFFHTQQKTHHGNIDEAFMYILGTLGTQLLCCTTAKKRRKVSEV